MALQPSLGFGCHLLLGPRNPALDTTGKPDLLADVMSGNGRKFGDLPDVKDSEIVELLFDRRRRAGELLEIVGHAARPGQWREAKLVSLRRQFLNNDRFSQRARVDALALRARDTVD